jgi:hypothetical protein
MKPANEFFALVPAAFLSVGCKCRREWILEGKQAAYNLRPGGAGAALLDRHGRLLDLGTLSRSDPETPCP